MKLNRHNNFKPKQSDDFEDDVDIDDEEERFSDDDGFDSFNDSMGGSYTPMDKHNDLLKELTNFEPFLKRLRYQFLGMVWSQSKEKYIRNPNIKPLMNEVGTEWCINYLTVYTRDNNILSSLMEGHFNGVMQDSIDVIGLNIATRSEEFGINKESEIGDCIKILNIMHDAILLILSGAGKSENYQKFLSTTTARQESIQLNNNPMNNNQQKKGTLESGINWLRGR